ncbi:MAG: 16S rRNA (guanine(527)-N(7))-methyltransferase RsmG [Rickettsiales bacterium]|nr:16S rRNA (guanine(527)-N(7))-methyltransferase RsmG [Rickettsiales bacterium]
MDYQTFSDHLHVSRETYDQLNQYVDLLMKWQSKINLISPTTVSDIWNRHILDCAQLYPLIDSHQTILDIGSGAGLPGLILSIMGAEDIHLVESDQRKAIFLKECKNTLGLNCAILDKRAENVSLTAHTITSRACASLSKLFALAAHNIEEGTICVFPKGENYAREIEEAKQDWEFAYQTRPSITHPASVVIIASDIRKR